MSEETKEATQAESAGGNWSSDTKDLGDKIVGLTLMQAKELCDYLKDVHGIEPAAGGAVMMAGPVAAGGGEEEAEKTSFDVILRNSATRRFRSSKRSELSQVWVSRKPRIW